MCTACRVIISLSLLYPSQERFALKLMWVQYVVHEAALLTLHSPFHKYHRMLLLHLIIRPWHVFRCYGRLVVADVVETSVFTLLHGCICKSLCIA